MRVAAPRRAHGPAGEAGVLFNAAPWPQTFTAPALAGARLGLHPVQQSSADPVVRTARFERGTGTFTVPARTTAVFVSAQGHHTHLWWR
jgi:hypothetical protein